MRDRRRGEKSHPQRPSPYTDRGPERFRMAGSYQVVREWRRYEGTPQREVLRRVRELFLKEALRSVAGRSGPRMEVGPGPGRFTVVLTRFPGTVVLLDASRAMLTEARRRVTQSKQGPAVLISPVQGDARWLPTRRGTFSAVVALGNVVGFAGKGSTRLLHELADAVASGGTLILETYSPVTASPGNVRRLSLPNWAHLLEMEPSEALRRILDGGFKVTHSEDRQEGRTSQFRFLDGPTLAGEMGRHGLTAVDQLIAAPLTGGNPELVASIAKLGRGYPEQLLKLENVAGRNPIVVQHGGHLLTSWGKEDRAASRS